MSFCRAAPSARSPYLPSTPANGGLPGGATLEATGRFFERAHDGAEVELGVVRLFEPARRLVLDWYPGTGRTNPTQVDVRFEAVAEGTRVTVTHGPGAAGADLFGRNAAAYDRSWELVLAALASHGESPV